MTGPNIQHFSQQPHILVVDDDRRIRELVSRFLREHDFIVMTAEDAGQARTMTRNFEYDALVVDVMMPGETGLEFTKYARDKLNIPVLLLTALGEAEDRIVGLESGADDYLPKPFEPRELVLRLNTILRRSPKKQSVTGPIKIGRWSYDPDIEALIADGEIVKLTTVEGKLIRALASRPGQAMSREELAKFCGVDSGERTIDVQVTRLRRKLEMDTKTPRYLQTVRGKGYLLRVEAS